MAPVQHPLPKWVVDFKTQCAGIRIKTDTKTRQAHSGDAWFASRLPEVVAFPKNTREVAAIMTFAHRHRVPVTPRGAGRGYVGGCVPQDSGIVLSTARMKRIVEINHADGVTVVQPAVITGHLQAEVKKRGLFYPPDPASLKECSIGGNVATNAGGPRCLKYGVTRTYVLGLEVVLATGMTVRVGGRTLKNKTGFDLIGMFVGSEGMLGVVTEITLRLLPHPRSRAVLSTSFANARQAAAAVQKILAGGFLPAALEVADAFTLQAARDHLGSRKVPPGAAHLLVEIDGQTASVRHETALLSKLLKTVGALEIKTARDEKGCEQLWELRRKFSESLKASGLTKLNEDITVPRGRLVDLFHFAEKLQKKFVFPVACFGHAGDGNIHVNIMVDLNKPGTPEKINQALDELFAQVIRWGGAITGEHGIGLAKKRWWEQATSPELRTLHRLIKSAVDPYHQLNPDKFV